MKAFHADPAIKAKYLARVRAHREADNMVQGTGWSSGKGCAVGCTLEAYGHSRYPIELGLPVWLAHLEDVIFEGLPEKDAMAWPERFLSVIRVGVTADELENVKHRLAIRRMERLLTFTSDRDVVAAIKMVRDCHALALEGGSPDWSAALDEAKAAAMRAAESGWAVKAAAEAAVWLTRSSGSAMSADWSSEAAVAAEAASWDSAWQQEADDLIELLEAA